MHLNLIKILTATSYVERFELIQEHAQLLVSDWNMNDIMVDRALRDLTRSQIVQISAELKMIFEKNENLDEAIASICSQLQDYLLHRHACQDPQIQVEDIERWRTIITPYLVKGDSTRLNLHPALFHKKIDPEKTASEMISPVSSFNVYSEIAHIQQTFHKFRRYKTAYAQLSVEIYNQTNKLKTTALKLEKKLTEFEKETAADKVSLEKEKEHLQSLPPSTMTVDKIDAIDALLIGPGCLDMVLDNIHKAQQLVTSRGLVQTELDEITMQVALFKKYKKFIMNELKEKYSSSLTSTFLGLFSHPIEDDAEVSPRLLSGPYLH